MVEKAANFTSTFQNRPSIFEVIAQNSLHETLHPALQKVALFFYSSNPQSFRFLAQYYDEVFLFLDGLLQYYYLKTYNASFSENFYGLKRVLQTNEGLTTDDKKWALFFLVFLPYLKRKFDEKIAMYKLQEADGVLNKKYERKFKRSLCYLHSSFEVTSRIVTLINYIRYMGRSTEVQLPVHYYLKSKLVYLTEPPDEGIGFWSTFFRGQLKISDFGFGLVRNALVGSIELTAFFLQFLQSWNNEHSNRNLTALPVVPAPPLDAKAKNYKGKCPLCLKTWKNPTVLQVSGYIFCFNCLVRYVGSNQKCPVTNLPAKPLDIVKVIIN